jgi:hypothetical protein
MAALAVATALGLSVSAGAAPVELSTQFTPPSATWLGERRSAADDVCRVRLESVADTRVDPHMMGTIAMRDIHVADSVAWFRSGIAALSRDPRLEITGDATTKDAIVLSVEIIKAYMLSQATAKSTNIVVRVRFSGRGGASAEQVYRGLDQDVNWWSSQDETQHAFDRAMANFLEALDTDLVARCNTS